MIFLYPPMFKNAWKTIDASDPQGTLPPDLKTHIVFFHNQNEILRIRFCQTQERHLTAG